jgi:hypothetical protein
MMPLFHFLIYLLTYFRYMDSNQRLKQLVEAVREMRVLPVPYGLLAHELVEVIDQERIMPGITWIGKFAEDYPFLDHHSTLKEKSSLAATEVTNPH